LQRLGRGRKHLVGGALDTITRRQSRRFLGGAIGGNFVQDRKPELAEALAAEKAAKADNSRLAHAGGACQIRDRMLDRKVRVLEHEARDPGMRGGQGAGESANGGEHHGIDAGLIALFKASISNDSEFKRLRLSPRISSVTSRRRLFDR
jgi:hypothetical protein